MSPEFTVSSVFAPGALAKLLETLSDRPFEGEAIISSVPDRPGALARLNWYLANSGVCMDGVPLLRWHAAKAELASSVDQSDVARRLLAGLMWADGDVQRQSATGKALIGAASGAIANIGEFLIARVCLDKRSIVCAFISAVLVHGAKFSSTHARWMGGGEQSWDTGC
jgi:hypothetical protein